MGLVRSAAQVGVEPPRSASARRAGSSERDASSRRQSGDSSTFYSAPAANSLLGSKRSGTPVRSMEASERNSNSHTASKRGGGGKSQPSSSPSERSRCSSESDSFSNLSMMGAVGGSSDFHSTLGIGATSGAGQSALAQDRDFAATFDACHAAIAFIEESTSSARCCVELQEELEEQAVQVEAMLLRLEKLFHADTSRTIVSLKQLCAQLEMAGAVSDRHSRPQSAVSRLCLCGRKSAYEAHAAAELTRATKCVHMYAVSMLLEHGFKASDLQTFSQGNNYTAYNTTLNNPPGRSRRRRDAARGNRGRKAAAADERTDELTDGPKGKGKGKAPRVVLVGPGGASSPGAGGEVRSAGAGGGHGTKPAAPAGAGLSALSESLSAKQSGVLISAE